MKNRAQGVLPKSVCVRRSRTPDSAPSVSYLDPSRCAVVLGSSFLGVYAHAGFLNGLALAGFAPGRIAGASAGAIAGALYASGLRGEALRDAALDVKLRRSFVDAGWMLRFPGLLTSLWASGLFTGAGAVARLKELCGDIDLAKLDPPLDVAVTDADTSMHEVRRSGPLAELVMASCAVPMLFEVQKVEGKCYLDGGIAGDLPFGHLIDDPSIDVLLLHRIRHHQGSTPGFFRRAIGHSFGVTRRTIANEVHRLRLDLARSRGKRVVEIETLTSFPGLFSHRLAPECYELGLATGLTVFQRLLSADG